MSSETVVSVTANKPACTYKTCASVDKFASAAFQQLPGHAYSETKLARLHGWLAGCVAYTTPSYRQKLDTLCASIH